MGRNRCECPAALIGGRLLGEGDRGWRVAGAGFIAAGVVALAG